MKLGTRAFALAVGIATAVVFAICAFFVALSPGSTAAFFSYLLHVDLTGLARPIGGGSFFTGLLGIGLVSALFAAAVTELYNRLSKGERRLE